MIFSSSYWVNSSLQTSFPKVSSNFYTDVCIIGGGITGIATRIYAKRFWTKSYCFRSI